MVMGKNRHPDYMTRPGERASYWSYFIGQNFFYTIVFSFLITYLTLEGIDLKKISIVMLMVKVWDAINDPLFGVIFDKVKFKNGKKCVPWLRISLAFIPITTVALFCIPSGASEAFKLIWFGMAYVMWDTFYTVCDVPIFSMVTTMTDNLNERNVLMSTGRIFSGVGGGIASFLCTFLISEKVGMNFSTIAVILAIAGFMFMLPICIAGKERNYHAELAEESFTIRQMLRYIVHNKYLLIYYGGFFCTGALATSGAVSMFVAYYLFGSATFNILLGILSVVPAMLSALVLPHITKRFDKFKILFWCNAVNVALGFVIYFVGWQNKFAFIALTVMRSATFSVVGILNFMFTPDCAEYGQYKTGVDAKGITFAIQTFSAKLTGAIASSLGLFVLSMFSWAKINASSFAEIETLGITQSDTALHGLWVTYALIPTIGAAISILFYLFYKLNDKDVQVMARCNSGEISREEAQQRLSRNY